MFRIDAKKKIRAWQNTANDVARFKAGISGHSKGERHHFANAIEQ